MEDAEGMHETALGPLGKIYLRQVTRYDPLLSSPSLVRNIFIWPMVVF